MEMSEAWSDVYGEEYIHQFQPKPTHKTLAVAEELILKISSHGTSLN